MGEKRVCKAGVGPLFLIQHSKMRGTAQVALVCWSLPGNRGMTPKGVRRSSALSKRRVKTGVLHGPVVRFSLQPLPPTYTAGVSTGFSFSSTASTGPGRATTACRPESGSATPVAGPEPGWGPTASGTGAGRASGRAGMAPVTRATAYAGRTATTAEAPAD